MPSLNALTLAHRFLSEQVKPGDFCIDATAGRGNDTALLCRLVGESGRVLAFDIQPEAVESTRKRLSELGLSHRAEVIQDSHSRLCQYARPGSVKAVVFNFGWLPGGDHRVFTHPETSIEALEQSLDLLLPDGVISICIYYGRETGFSERNALLSWLEAVDSRQYSVLLQQFPNRPNCPPMAAFVMKGV